MRLLVTGGAGFIGSHFVRKALAEGAEVLNLDLLTYAGGLDTMEDFLNHPKHRFVKGDIKDRELVMELMGEVEYVVHFAAETHVDRSILEGGDFVLTDVYGTYVLLEAARRRGSIKKFLHISTDEVYGPIEKGSFREGDPLNPSSPYAASKAGADRLAYAFHRTYGLPVVIVRPSNNYGPYQHPEKAIPLFITNLLEGKKIPLYGTGENIREWVFVEDCVEGLWILLEKSQAGECYNLSSNFELKNIELARKILEIMGMGEDWIEFVQDRPGHDVRYSVDSSKVRGLGWRPRVGFEAGLRRTVEWYKNHRDWWERRKSGEFQQYYKRVYGGSL